MVMNKKIKYEEMLEHIKNDELKREETLRNIWENLKPFNDPIDVPFIPIVDNELYKSYYIPKLINAGAIPKKDLINGQTYIGNHRRCSEAKWDEEKNKFIYKRYKFNMYFDDTCNHFEDDDGFALFVPIKIKPHES